MGHGSKEPLGMDVAPEEVKPAAGKKPLKQKPAEEATTPAAAAEEATARGRQSAAPICPKHNVACVAKHSNPYFTYYYCPEEGCSLSVKQARPELTRRMDVERGAAPDFDQRPRNFSE